MMSKLTGYLTSHGLLNYHQWKLGNNAATKDCRFCNKEDETNCHVLFECPAMVMVRLSEIGSPFVGKQDVGCLSISTICKLIKSIEKHFE